jgi:large subunit ribosomal protein L23
MDLKFVLKQPLITEKGTFLSSKGGYVFRVDRQATKSEIKKAAKKFLKVKVEQVKTAKMVGKKRKALKSRKQFQQADWKKAIIFLKPGEKIDLFETGE